MDKYLSPYAPSLQKLMSALDLLDAYISGSTVVRIIANETYSTPSDLDIYVGMKGDKAMLDILRSWGYSVLRTYDGRDGEYSIPLPLSGLHRVVKLERISRGSGGIPSRQSVDLVVYSDPSRLALRNFHSTVVMNRVYQGTLRCYFPRLTCDRCNVGGARQLDERSQTAIAKWVARGYRRVTDRKHQGA